MKTPLQRFWTKVLKTDYCWLWIGAPEGRVGYGRLLVNGKRVIAHRYAYEQFKRPIPEGMVIDHLCLTPLCVNPDYLEAVSNKENILRGVSLPAQAARRTECAKGHQYSVSNLFIRPDGARGCRTCNWQYQQEYRQRLKVRAGGQNAT